MSVVDKLRRDVIVAHCAACALGTKLPVGGTVTNTSERKDGVRELISTTFLPWEIGVERYSSHLRRSVEVHHPSTGGMLTVFRHSLRLRAGRSAFDVVLPPLGVAFDDAGRVVDVRVHGPDEAYPTESVLFTQGDVAVAHWALGAMGRAVDYNPRRMGWVDALGLALPEQTPKLG